VTRPRIEHQLAIQICGRDVFEFVSDRDHLPAWTNGVSRAKCTTPGPIGVGTTYTVIGRTVGRRVESTYEVTAYEPSTRFSGRLVSKLFSIEETYEFEGEGEQTTVRLTADATASGRMRLLGPFLGLAVDRQIKSDHQRLKTILERRRRRTPARPPRAEPATERAEAPMSRGDVKPRS